MPIKAMIWGVKNPLFELSLDGSIIYLHLMLEQNAPRGYLFILLVEDSYRAKSLPVIDPN
jgi:hypothetical protein